MTVGPALLPAIPANAITSSAWLGALMSHPAFADRTQKPGKTLVELPKELDQPQPKNETDPAKLKTVDTSK